MDGKPNPFTLSCCRTCKMGFFRVYGQDLSLTIQSPDTADIIIDLLRNGLV